LLVRYTEQAHRVLFMLPKNPAPIVLQAGSF
jgi:hypothetical protein